MTGFTSPTEGYVSQNASSLQVPAYQIRALYLKRKLSTPVSINLHLARERDHPQPTKNLNHIPPILFFRMRSLLSLVLFLFAALVSAVSTAGNRLLVVLDSPDDKKAYTTFFGDLSGTYHH